MARTDRALIAHLMRRAAFGATASEIDTLSDKKYEDLVEGLLHPERAPAFEEDVLRRYYLELNNADSHVPWQSYWIYRMVNTPRPMEEKIALFWHHIFATSIGKSEHTPSSRQQIDTFRRTGLSNLRTIYLELARDPAMLFWLDNCENHRGEPNENWGRELLELFSMGVGNYTEQDIKMASRAFTGWTFTQPLPLDPYGRFSSEFQYLDTDHDRGEKTFLGRSGSFDGEDIIDIIVGQPATHRFIARHMYNFFVADEPQVPAWGIVPPQDPGAIDALAAELRKSGGDVRATLRLLFNSDFFKAAIGRKVKSPVELVVGTVKLAGSHRFPEPGLSELATAVSVMGQALMTPPTVEGWHTGKEWIDAGTLNERVNFAVNQFSNPDQPGVQAFVRSLKKSGGAVSPDRFVDRCLEWLGPFPISADTRRGLVERVRQDGDVRADAEDQRGQVEARGARLVQAIVSSIEYQLA
jgi:uncharacterized protein (DUF1800 family)